MSGWAGGFHADPGRGRPLSGRGRAPGRVLLSCEDFRGLLAAVTADRWDSLVRLAAGPTHTK